MLKDFRNVWFLFKICLKAAPGYVSAYIFDKIRNEAGIFLGFTIIFQFVLDSAEFGRPFLNVLFVLVSFIIFNVLHLLFDSARQKKLAPKALPVIQRRLKGMLFERAREIDIEAYDNPEFYNDYIMAIQESDNQIDRILSTMEGVVSSVTRTILAAGFFIVVDPGSFVFVIVSFVLLLALETMINKLNFEIRLKKNPIERKFEYVNRVFYLPDYAKELRLNPDAASRLQSEFAAVNDELLTIDKSYARKLAVLGWLRDYVFSRFIINAMYMAYLVYGAAVLGRFSFGNVAVFHGTARRLSYGFWGISRAYTDIADISRYVERIHVFLDKKPQILSTENLPVPKDAPAEIEIRNVSFRYSEAAPFVLQNVCMKIPAGEKAAIVGYNGAGKSTLVKLVMRLYDPTGGEIFLGGVNIKKYNVEEYRCAIGVIFQDYKIFSATVRENVTLDVPESTDGETPGGINSDVLPALKQAGFYERLLALPLGIEQPLTTEFDENGVNLSGGEAQKVAIARAFHKDSPLIILDEPSSALDPLAEYHFNHSVTSSSGEKTMVFISHRLSTTRIADTVFLMENGRVAEHGNHTKLLAQNGKYAEMWKAQTSRYLTGS